MKNKIVSNAIKISCKEKILYIIFLIIAIVAGIVMQLIPPQILKSIIDNNISKGVYEGIWKLSLYYLLAVVFSGAFDFLREFMMAIIGQNILLNIRLNMAKKLSKLPISYFSNNAVGEIMSKFTQDVDAVGTLFTSGLIGIISDGLKTIGIIISIYILSPKLALYVLVLIPIIYLIARFFKSNTFKSQMDARKAVGHINGSVQEIFNGLRTIKIFGMENYFISDFQEPLNQNLEAVHKTSTLDSIFPCIMQILRAIVITIAVIVAAPKGLGSLGISIGSIAAAVDLISRMLAPIEAIAVEFQTIQEAISGLERINEFDSEEEEIKYIQEKPELMKDVSISVQDVSFAYDNGKEIVQNISFDVKQGTKAALVGRTGAGKSTILNLVAGLYRPKEGSIKIGGMDPFEMPFDMRRRTIGIVPQAFPIYDGTVKEAITLYDETITEEEIIAAAKSVGLHEDIMKLSNGYDTFIGEGEIKFSHGQYQLLSLACALVCNPPILLLDEVTSGLDSITEAKIFKVLREVSKDRTILTISHRISGIIDADKVVILEKGKIVETGTPEELAGKDGWYAKYNQIEQLGWKI
ncbi:ABC transporter ATP-binding protein [Sporanaerobacter acetigenes]|uniref:ATP-binding cassette, subfamily B n=1 Tax=Sporanaerobacter acetigenes DSM 13106 TaxID=1123281 RepID=A0A1M5WC74_9FIRM|nr:ABC transporter ATP-binding protein [Sporanaerobacter acetigenes]SHH84813.1 ATP-binding cassette, subfamily B [Sporanaerobacter acetigenes DSM 13106]